MALTPIATPSSDGVNNPSSIVRLVTSGRPSDDNSFTPDLPKNIYTAPNSCKRAEIRFLINMDNANELSGNTSNNFYYGLQILCGNGSIKRIFDGTLTSRVSINSGFADIILPIPSLEEDAVYFKVTYSGTNQNRHFLMGKDKFILGPGDSFQVTTTSPSNSEYYRFDMDVWVYE